MAVGREPVTVLGVMARAPVPGRCKSRLARHVGAELSAAVYRSMLIDCLTAFSRIPARRHVVLAAPECDGVRHLRALAPPAWEVQCQQGADLGERLAHGFETLGAGGEAVALLSSDSPTLPISEVAAGLRALDGPNKALIGPCDDGGYYLIGLSTFEPTVLSEIPWSTAEVLQTTRQRCRALGLSVTELPTWYDVDDLDDLGRLQRELAEDPTRAESTARLLARESRLAARLVRTDSAPH